MLLDLVRGAYMPGLLAIWQTCRTAILLTILTILVIFRVILHVRYGERHTIRSLLPDSPLPSPVGGEKRAGLLDSKSTTPPQPGLVVAAEDRKSPRTNGTRLQPKRALSARDPKATGSLADSALEDQALGFLPIQPLIFFYSMTGSSAKIATEFTHDISKSLESSQDDRQHFLRPLLYDLAEIDYDDYFISPPKSDESSDNAVYFYLFILPTYNIDSMLIPFLDHLRETHHDFRINNAPLTGLLGYSVFGIGDKEGWPTEEEGFCTQAKEVDKWMAKLTGRKRAFPVGLGDIKSDVKKRLDEWRKGLEDVLSEAVTNGGLGEGFDGSGDPIESDEEDFVEEDEDQVTNGTPITSSRKRQNLEGKSNIDDLEDLGRLVKKSPEVEEGTSSSDRLLAIDFTTYGTKSVTSQPPSDIEMVPKTSSTWSTLTKQGYTIVGSHSGVKICRWTKSALRGRGSCYKYSFYGIKSHLCMETTPSLSCSSKCVFCWRHGTNPVGTTWRWKVDPPEMIFEGVKNGHYKKIKMMKGVPGIRAERFAEAMQIRHCALSLVGEPIFYPHINEFTAMLHAERISSFLVCNAQHPDQLAALKPVTQLYVSIDASNRESLKKIDRPLYRDFWERFQRCLDILRERRNSQRTVFRLTLVKGFNIDDEVEGYADLVQKGLPCFVEVKGVTYCGKSTTPGVGLTMQNVPFYAEVTAFVIALNAALEKRGLSYGIAAEHAHSCCMLIASTRFHIQGKWHTLIDYDKFFELLELGRDFGPEDYVGPPTPQWANWGNGGFDPADQRVYPKGKNKGLVVGSDGSATNSILVRGEIVEM
ncbi:MAG: hypothetical protein M1829_001325 [Trizodia sp. TS-e1964]|nr:MAG: hypothetical protein M1829_001325 [Trizodia sp. TS-e1964]